MREHIFLPRPLFTRHVCFPDFIGGYSDFPEHSVNREYQTTDLNLDTYYNLHIVLEGKGYLLTEGTRYELTAGQGFMYAPGTRQSYRSDSKDPWSIRWIHFFGGQLGELMGGKGLDEPWLFSITDLPPVKALLDQMLTLGRSYQIEDEFRMASTLYELLIRLQSRSDRLNLLANQSADKIREVANYIRSHSSEPFTIDQAAAMAGYSTYYFSRKFGEAFGMSFPEFLLEARLIQAKRLLASTSLTVKQIASSTGFAQPSYFSSCFKRLEGMTPLQFRSLHMLDNHT